MTIASPETTRSRRRSPSSPLARERLRLWLRLLRASRGIETELRERLRIAYDMTLPQFDVLAALARHRGGITMTVLSRYLMVSNGNVTGIVDRLVDDGWIERQASPGDRRATLVQLTAKGAAEFADMAAEHETWVDELLARFNKADVAVMIGHLDGLVDELRGPTPRATPARKGGKRK